MWGFGGDQISIEDLHNVKHSFVLFCLLGLYFTMKYYTKVPDHSWEFSRNSEFLCSLGPPSFSEVKLLELYSLISPFTKFWTIASWYSPLLELSYFVIGGRFRSNIFHKTYHSLWFFLKSPVPLSDEQFSYSLSIGTKCKCLIWCLSFLLNESYATIIPAFLVTNFLNFQQ